MKRNACAIAVLWMISASSVSAHGIGTNLYFDVDESKSGISVQFFDPTSGGSVGTTDSSPLAGSFTLNLGNPGAGSPLNWDTFLSLEGSAGGGSWLVGATAPMNINDGSGVQVQFNSLEILDVDQADAVDTVLANGAANGGISSGALFDDVRFNTNVTITIPIFGSGTTTIDQWAASSIQIEVADAPLLSVNGSGNLEAHLTMEALIPTNPSDPSANFIKADVQLWGAASQTLPVTPVPLPAAVWLFAGGVLPMAFVARRRHC